MKLKSIIGFAATTLAFAFSNGASAQSLTIVSGTSCAGATSANFTVGVSQTISVCAVTPAASTCGASIQFVAANATENDLFRITARTRGASFDTDNNGAYTFGANTITTPANTQDFGASSAAAVAAATGVVVASFDITPQAGATAASYTVSLGGVSSVLATSTNCAAAAETPSTPSFTLNAAVVTNTAPTVSALAGTTLTGGTGTVPVNVATAGTGTGSLALNCSIPAGTASFAVTAGGTRTINAPATLGANAPAIGLSCTPQSAAVNGTLTCTQTATPGPNPADLTATITCPAIVSTTPAVSISAAPTSVPDNGSSTTITVTSSLAAPAGGLSVNLTVPAATGLFQSTTCVSPIVIAATQTTATCTATAATNTTPGDGPTNVNFAIAAAGAGQYTIGTGTVAVSFVNDDAAPTANVTATAASITEGGLATFTLACTGTGGPFAVPFTINTIGTDTGPTPASPVNLTCGTPVNITVQTAQNTIAGDSRTLTLTLGTLPAGLTLGTGTASVTVADDDAVAGAAVNIPTIGAFGIGLMTLLIAGFGALAQRRRKQ
jgi:hypothetical protein